MSDENGKKNYFAEVMQEIIVAAGDPSLTLQDVESKLQVLYGTAEGQGDQQTMALVQQTYDGFLAISAQTGHAMNFAANARELAERVVQQRDDLDEKVKTLQAENEALQEQLDEDPWESGIEEMIYDNITEEFVENLAAELDVERETALYRFIGKLNGDGGYSDRERELLREIIAINREQVEEEQRAWEEKMKKLRMTTLRGTNG